MIRILLLLVLLAVTGSPVSFARAENLDAAKAGREAQARGEVDEAIRLYTEAIETGSLGPENLAIVHNNRGIAYWSKGDFDKALVDYSAAIKLRPDYVAAYDNRGVVYRDLGQTDKEIADFNEAIGLNADDAFAYENRGRARLHTGQVKEAIADLGRAVALDPTDSYAVLWLHLARTFAGQDDALEFARNAQTLDAKHWPAPIIDLYLGLATPEKVRTAALVGDARTQKIQTCEANFYVGAFQLLHGAKEQAKPLFEAAAKGCPPTYLEAEAAKAQLKRLER
ncbi:MAG TPA: tetratricopeptide repeat protein [Alphaproteobacteria bacterium]|nr:tetratricopeptide repeat protein [Alphaproteobacteria bacterium]